MLSYLVGISYLVCQSVVLFPVNTTDTPNHYARYVMQDGVVLMILVTPDLLS